MLQFLDLMRRYQAQYLAVPFHDKATASGPQHVVLNELLHIRIPIHHHAVVRHHIAHPDALKAGGQRDSGVAGAGGLQQKPSDEGDPQAANSGTAEERNIPSAMKINATAWPVRAASCVAARRSQWTTR